MAGPDEANFAEMFLVVGDAIFVKVTLHVRTVWAIDAAITTTTVSDVNVVNVGTLKLADQVLGSSVLWTHAYQWPIL